MVLNDKNRQEMTVLYFDKALKAFNSCLFLAIQSDYDGAVNRAYYAMFLAEKALLLTRGILGDRHKHTHMSISKEFIKDGELPKDTYRRVKIVEGIRHTADYSGTRSVTKEEVYEVISETNIFLIHAKKILIETMPHAFSKNEQEEEKIQNEVQKALQSIN